MEGIFALPYSEYAVAERLSALLTKTEGYTVTMPLSRQNKGWDLLLHSADSGRAARIQVKSSRGFRGGRSKKPGAKYRFDWYFWFNSFEFKEDAADFYVLFGLYPAPDSRATGEASPVKWWRQRILLFSSPEMRTFLMKPGDRFFDLGFDLDEQHCLFRIRGATYPGEECYKRFLIDDRVADLQAFLCGEPEELRNFEHHPPRSVSAA